MSTSGASSGQFVPSLSAVLAAVPSGSSSFSVPLSPQQQQQQQQQTGSADLDLLNESDRPSSSTVAGGGGGARSSDDMIMPLTFTSATPLSRTSDSAPARFPRVSTQQQQAPAAHHLTVPHRAPDPNSDDDLMLDLDDDDDDDNALPSEELPASRKPAGGAAASSNMPPRDPLGTFSGLDIDGEAAATAAAAVLTGDRGDDEMNPDEVLCESDGRSATTTSETDLDIDDDDDGVRRKSNGGGGGENIVKDDRLPPSGANKNKDSDSDSSLDLDFNNGAANNTSFASPSSGAASASSPVNNNSSSSVLSGTTASNGHHQHNGFTSPMLNGSNGGGGVGNGSFLNASSAADQIAYELSAEDQEEQRRQHQFYNDEIKSLMRGKLIGKGNFGNVYMARSASGRVYAVKQVRIASDDSSCIKGCRREVELMVHLPPHRNCVRYVGSRVSTRHFSIVMEYVKGGTVQSQLRPGEPMPEKRARAIVRDVLTGLRHLHACNVVHQDIKGANVLLSSKGCAKIADFGCARDISRLTHREGGGGTPMWMAPEVCTGSIADKRADIWALGCLVLEMLNPAHVPWANFAQGITLFAVLYSIGHATQPPPFPPGISPECEEFLLRTLAVDPDDRWTADALLAKSAFVQLPDQIVLDGMSSDSDDEEARNLPQFPGQRRSVPATASAAAPAASFSASASASAGSPRVGQRERGGSGASAASPLAGDEMLSRDELMRRASSGIHAAFNSPGRGPPVPAAAVVAAGDASAAEIRDQPLTAAAGSIPSHRIPRPQPLQGAGDLEELDDLMRTAGTAEQREIERLRRQPLPNRGRDTMDLGIVNIHDSVGRMHGGDSMDDAMLRGKRRGSDSASGTRSNGTASGAGSVAATQRSVDYAQGLRVVDSAPAANMQDILRRAPASPSGAAAGAVVVPGASGFPVAAAAVPSKPVLLFSSSGGGRVDSPLQHEPSVGL